MFLRQLGFFSCVAIMNGCNMPPTYKISNLFFCFWPHIQTCKLIPLNFWNTFEIISLSGLAKWQNSMKFKSLLCFTYQKKKKKSLLCFVWCNSFVVSSLYCILLFFFSQYYQISVLCSVCSKYIPLPQVNCELHIV